MDGAGRPRHINRCRDRKSRRESYEWAATLSKSIGHSTPIPGPHAACTARLPPSPVPEPSRGLSVCRRVYKISDFGASRQPKENDECHSLAGTEEYLHPAIYHGAFLDSRMGHVTYRGDCADMWSLGCTLYHACSGSTPFLPHGGARRNRLVMFQMISKKPRGAIAGEQREPGGSIVWRKDLPSTCNMSESLRGHVRPLIAGVLEVEGQWTFETFDLQAGEVTRLVPHWLLVANTPSLAPLYTRSDVTLVEFQEAVAVMTEVPACHQSLYFGEHRLTSSVPLSSPSDPLFLVVDSESEVQPTKLMRTLEPFHTLQPGTAGVSVERDANTALRSCAALHRLAGSVATSGWLVLGLLALLRALSLEVQTEARRLTRWWRMLQAVFSERRLRWEMLRDVGLPSAILSRQQHAPSSSSTERHVTQRHADARALSVKVEQLLRQVQQALKQLGQLGVDAEASPGSRDVGSVTSPVPSERAEQCLRLLEGTKEIWRNMENRKSIHHFSQYEALLHQTDRKKLSDQCARAVAVWQEDWSVHLRSAFQAFCQQHRLFSERRKKISQIESLLSGIKNGSDRLLEITQEISCFYGKEKTEFEGRIKESVYGILKEGRSQESPGTLMQEASAIRHRFSSVLEELPDLTVLSDT